MQERKMKKEEKEVDHKNKKWRETCKRSTAGGAKREQGDLIAQRGEKRQREEKGAAENRLEKGKDEMWVNATESDRQPGIEE